MKRLLTVVGSCLCFFSFTFPAVAQAVRAVPVSQARGDRQIVTVDLYPGHGTTLNFRSTGETVRRAWLDDLSKVTLSFDDASCSVSETENECAAQVIHLRRINPLEFPNLPTTETTLLTVLTDGGLYLFRLAFPEAGNPSYYSLEIQPDSLNTEIQPQPVAASVEGSSGAQLIEQGLKVAEARNLIAEGDLLWERLQNLIAAVRQGVHVEVAAAQTGVSQELIVRLVELGQTVSPSMTL
jgi:hypothetical protein